MAKIENESDIRGAVKLTFEAMHGITDLVEAMHCTIAGLGGIGGGSNQARTTGITGMVYRNIRKISGWVGDGIDLCLRQFPAQPGERRSSPERERVLALLNGVLGDRLAARNNPLAIPMQFRRNGAPLNMGDPGFNRAVRHTNGKIALMVHGPV